MLPSGQISDKGIQVIKEMLNQKVDKYKCFRRDSKGVLWFEDRLVVPKIQNSGRKSWTKLISQNFACVTPLVLLQLKLEHAIINIGIAYV
jgi:trans-2-enoyl-CoA reductase